MPEMPKAHNPREVEDKIYKIWEESGFFNPDNLDLPKGAEKFVISMPPPNATGVLHLGHASMLAYQDLMARYNRMNGRRVLWLPGTDHAAIATQAKVEKIIAKEGKTKYDLGREKFIKRVEKYIENSRNIIKNQTKKMGSSCDWGRERYTLDDGLSRAVREVFVKMYQDRLIYRGDRIVNWCPRCESTLADDEVEYRPQKAKLYYFKYQKDFPITIATTRPETKLGDSAVAVNPKDERYKKYIGQVYKINLGNGEHNIKIIADREVDMNFGTGALGVTPAHSMTDWEMAEKNGLEKIKIIGEDGKMNANAGAEYEYLAVPEVREKFAQYLEKNKLIEKVEKVDQSLSICYRCDTPIEPLPSKQWFVSISSKFKVQSSKFRGIKKGQKASLKELALAVVKSGQIKIIPERFEKTYLHWMENLHDWCISRQIWFGHRIPVWHKFKVQSSKFKVAVQNSEVEGGVKELKIAFIRHCQSEGNAKDIAEGRIDSALTDKGKEQAREIAKAMDVKIYNAVFCSTLNRAKETADIIFGKNRIIYDDRLVEIDFGDLTGSKTSELDKFRETGFPNGEKYTDVVKRVNDFLKEIESNYQGKHIAIVAHSGVWKALEHIINNQPLDSNFLNRHAYFGLIEYEKPNSKFDDEIYVGVESPNGEGWTQDEDTLDTWFSSGLWTFSTLLDQEHKKYKTFKEWVAGSPDLKKYHPTTAMETGYDILFFWVARMILMTTYTMGEVPFENVYLHGMVRDKEGKKMSKSLGNGINPIEMIEKYGTDALRLSMIIGASPGNDIKLYEEKVEGYRNFVNKLWNISRYVLMTVSEESLKQDSNIEFTKIKESHSLFDNWILFKTQIIINKVSERIDNYEFSAACEILKDFTWNEFADWYIEIAKIEAEKYEKDRILVYVLKNLLKLWHPFAPFVTEKIWSEFGEGKLLMIEKWSKKDIIRFPGNALFEAELIIDIIKAIRSVRAEYGIKPDKKIKAIIYTGEKEELIKSEAETIKRMRTYISELEIKKSGERIKDAVYLTVRDVEIYLLDLIDKEKETRRIQKEIEDLKKYSNQINIKLSNKQFIANAPANIVKKEKEKLRESEEKLKKLEEKLKSFELLTL